jgi:hypothetical protein
MSRLWPHFAQTLPRDGLNQGDRLYLPLLFHAMSFGRRVDDNQETVASENNPKFHITSGHIKYLDELGLRRTYLLAIYYGFLCISLSACDYINYCAIKFYVQVLILK